MRSPSVSRGDGYSSLEIGYEQLERTRHVLLRLRRLLGLVVSQLLRLLPVVLAEGMPG